MRKLIYFKDPGKARANQVNVIPVQGDEILPLEEHEIIGWQTEESEDENENTISNRRKTIMPIELKGGQPALANVTLKEINLWFALRFNLRDRGMIKKKQKTS